MKLLYIDLFCGAGGTSTGVENARYKGGQCAKVIACVNHDANAIASHAANHPDALHFTEDIRTLELSPLVAHTESMRKKYPDAFVVLWASLECTNFSKAKGGQPRDADSRTLAEHLYRYIEAINPDYIQIENVEEFMSWGDLDENGKPISRDKGRLYTNWVDNVKAYGYKFDHRILNAADYGAYTSRKRFFGVFAKHCLPIVWPKPTHSKTGGGDLFGSLEKWKPVKEVLDFSDEGESIFNRKKPLSPKTLERIYAGLIKFVAGGKDSFLIKYNSVNKKTGKHIPPSIDEPCPTVAYQNRLGIANIHFLAKHFSGHPESKVSSVDNVAGTITTVDHHSLVGAEFISAYYGNGNNHSVNAPSPTITTKDRLSVVRPQFIANSYSGGGQLSDLDNPCPAVMTNPKQNVITKDNVQTEINALLYFQIVDPFKAVYEIDNLPNAIEKLTQTTLRNIIGELELDQTLTSRDTINTKLRAVLDDATNKWGIKVNRVELQDITPPESVLQAMEKQMQAERNKRATILTSEGEKAAAILKSEGEKTAIINKAEADKQMAILNAEGEAQARIRKAEAEAIAIEKITEAVGKSTNPANYLLAQKYIQMLQEVATGDKTKTVYLPYEATNLMGSIGGIKDLFKSE